MIATLEILQINKISNVMQEWASNMFFSRHKKEENISVKKLTFYPLSPAARADKAEFFTSILSSFFLSRHVMWIGLTLTALKTIKLLFHKMTETKSHVESVIAEEILAKVQTSTNPPPPINRIPSTSSQSSLNDSSEEQIWRKSMKKIQLKAIKAK